MSRVISSYWHECETHPKFKCPYLTHIVKETPYDRSPDSTPWCKKYGRKLHNTAGRISRCERCKNDKSPAMMPKTVYVLEKP